ncbi:MAG: hypothetical protein ACT4P7_15815 [Gemmatimonadaceae bacterium]
MRAVALGLAAVGAIIGGTAVGYLAHSMGYPGRDTALLTLMGAVACATALALLPALVKALYWTLGAALVGAVGVAALWLLSRINPILLRAFLEELR